MRVAASLFLTGLMAFPVIGCAQPYVGAQGGEVYGNPYGAAPSPFVQAQFFGDGGGEYRDGDRHDGDRRDRDRERERFRGDERDGGERRGGYGGYDDGRQQEIRRQQEQYNRNLLGQQQQYNQRLLQQQQQHNAVVQQQQQYNNALLAQQNAYNQAKIAQQRAAEGH